VISFAELVDIVRESPEQVARCWHPEPDGTLVQAKNGSSIQAMTGKPAYQLTTGQIIEV